MITADWIVLVGALVFIVLGWLVGFGRGLRFFTKGIKGIILSVFFCYIFGGLILQFSFVQQLLDSFIGALNGKNAFCSFLVKIHIDIVVYYIALFIVAQLARILIVFILKHIAEANNRVMKIINRTLGLILFFAVYFFIVILVFQIVSWLGGDTEESFIAYFSGSKIWLDSLYLHNPLLTLVERIKNLV